MLKINFGAFFSRFYSSYTKTSPLNNKKIVLYGDEASPPVRFVLMTASVLDIKIDYHEIDIFIGKQKSEFYKNINPLQKVPALLVQNQVICDSHAICLYLCKLSGDEKLYPSEISIRARIDEMLFFNSGTLFPIDSTIFTDYFAGKWPVNEAKLDMLNFSLDYIESRLNKNSWLAGDEISLADMCLMSTITSVYQIVRRSEKHKKVNEWLKKCEMLPFYEINRRGLERLLKFVEMKKHPYI
ncbi:glutathione S-transferase 1-like isoform X1 [Epargyreus clarus]|uniref:glutathione S-transferase 1-like isoform X1 n=1 Tax=Epargyreus clarus TaxID=520877 RepID=UPI003C2E0D0C